VLIPGRESESRDSPHNRPNLTHTIESTMAQIRAAGCPRRHHHEGVKRVTGSRLPPNEPLGDAMGGRDDIFDAILDTMSDDIAVTARQTWPRMVISDLSLRPGIRKQHA
jgi:hypothetical protein